MNQNLNKTQETGRSMVEMLGVLAVIGVLSITGITGYTTAMNKHKANQILDAASKRAVAVSTQIQRGNTNPTLAEFEDNKVGGAEFSTTYTPVGTNRFKIAFASGPDPDVLAQIKSIAGSDGIVRDIDGGLIYNNDLTTDAVASDYKTQSDCTTAGKQWCSNNTCAESCGPTCPGDSSSTAIEGGTSFEVSASGQSITCWCGEGKSFQGNACTTAPTTACSSWTTNVCGLGYYCDFNQFGQSCSSGSPTVSGKCKAISSVNSNEGIQAAGHWYLASGMDQWTANSWCIGKGSSGLISFEGLTSVANTNGVTVNAGYCEGQYCDPSTENQYLYNGFGGSSGLPESGYWTSQDYAGDGTSCNAYRVFVNSYDENVDHRDRGNYNADYYALCE